MEHMKLIREQKHLQRYSTCTKLTEHKVRYLYSYIWKDRWRGVNFISSSCSRFYRQIFVFALPISF